MKQTIEKIERALIALDALDDESKKALAELNEVTEGIEDDPIQSDFRIRLAGAADQLLTARDEKEDDTDRPSKALSSIESYLAEAVSEHPRLALAVGRLANALSVSGL